MIFFKHKFRRLSACSLTVNNERKRFVQTVQVGRANKPLYERYAELKNELSRLNGHDDLGDAWRDKYETETFGADVQSLYRDMEPLYLELHAYIRRKVRNIQIKGRCMNKERIPRYFVIFCCSCTMFTERRILI